MKSFKALLCASFLLNFNAFSYTCYSKTKTFNYEFKHIIGEDVAYLTESSRELGISPRTYRMKCNTSLLKVLCDGFEKFTLEEIDGYPLAYDTESEKVLNKSHLVVKGKPDELKIIVKSDFEGIGRRKEGGTYSYSLEYFGESGNLMCHSW